MRCAGDVGAERDGSMCCVFQDGWVGFKAVLLKKKLTAADFYNGYLHRALQQRPPSRTAEGRFLSPNQATRAHERRDQSEL